MSLNQLKNFDADRHDLDELVALSAEGKALQAEFVAQSVEVPEWLGTAVATLGREIVTRNRESLEKRARQLRSRINAMKPLSERRAEADAELAALEAKLK